MVKVLNREQGKRMWGGKSNVYGVSGGGTGGGDVDLSSYATMAWTKQNFVSIDYFRTLFKAFDSNDNEIVPNNTTSVVNNIKAMVGLWTEQYLTALGNQSGGGGGGGGAQYLNDLLDVQLTTPLTDGQALVYNATLQKWVNGAAGVNMTTVWNALAGSTNEQINASHLSTALSGYVTTSAISDMATQTWVSQQGFATQTWVTSNFITIAYFDRLFRAYNNSTLVSHNDTTTTIDNIKAMFGFWTDFYLSALGTGGVSSFSISLSQLADVNVAGVTNGQALVYDATNNQWVNGTITSGVSSLANLSDVLISAPSAGQALTYDAVSAKWVNTGGYLPLTGGTMTGAITYSSTGSNVDQWINFVASDNITYRIGIRRPVSSYGLAYVDGTNYYTILHTGNIKTINGQSIYGSGDISVGGGASGNYLPLTGGTLVGALEISNGYTFKLSYSTDIMTDFSFGNNSAETYIEANYYHELEIGFRGGYYPVRIYTSRNNGNRDLGYVSFGGTNGIYIGHPSDSAVDVIERYNGGPIYLNYYSGGNVCIGAIASTYKLNVLGDIYATGGVTALSDIRHKTVIRDAAVSVEDIARMPAVMYQWNDGREDKELHVGSIAQNWQTVLPEVVLKANDKEGTLSMQYGVAALVSSIIIARKVVNHEQRIKQLEKENKELKKRLNIA